MTYDYQIGDGAHAIDQQQFLDWHRGYQVVDPAGGSNLVDDNNTSDLVVRSAAGDINAGGTTVTCAEETVDLAAEVDPDDPKKITVYRDGSGTLNYSAGIAEPAQDQGETRRNAYRPSPPTLSGTNAVVLATVWLPAGATTLTDSDIRDRRLAADLPLETVSAVTVDASSAVQTPELNGGVTGSNSLTDIAGQNLNIVSGALDLVSSLTSITDIAGSLTGGQTVDTLAGDRLSINGGSLDADAQFTTTTIDDTDSPYTTSDEGVVYADTSAGAVTVTLSSADAALGNEIRVVNIDGSNAVTVDTEGAETIDPNADASKTITQAGWGVSFTADGSNWDSTLAAEHESVSTDNGTIGGDPILGGPSTGTAASIPFDGGFTTVDANQPVLLFLNTFAQTDGTTAGVVTIKIDYSGGTSPDLTFDNRADKDAASGFSNNEYISLYLPAGSSVEIENTQDPTGSNTSFEQEKYIISS